MAEKKKSIWEEVVESGVKYDHHESDLYLPVNKKTEEIVNRHPKVSVVPFTDQETGKLWFDIAFAYLPWWEKKG